MNNLRPLEPQRIFETLPPSTYFPRVERLKRSRGGYFVARNGVIISGSGVRMDMNYSMLKPMVLVPAIAILSFLRRGAGHVPASADGRYLGLIHSPWTAGYYHWMTESLPRALALKKQFPNSIPLLPSSKYLKYVDSLKAIGFQSVAFFPDQKNAHLSELVVTSSPSRFATTAPESLIAVRNTILRNLGLAEASSADDVVYISRSKSRGRLVHNEGEILQKISHLSPKLVNCEDLSFEEQVSLMRHTKLLISIHGAGLTNMMFLPEGAKVLELLPKRNGLFDFNLGRSSFRHDASYVRLAESLGLEHAFLENHSSARRTQSTHMANIYVDPDIFKHTVDAILLGSGV